MIYFYEKILLFLCCCTRCNLRSHGKRPVHDGRLHRIARFGRDCQVHRKCDCRFQRPCDGIDAHINPSNAGQYINITSADGDVYKPTSFKAGIGSSIDNLDLTFPAITKAGTYTLTIAAGVVKDYDQAETATRASSIL